MQRRTADVEVGSTGKDSILPCWYTRGGLGDLGTLVVALELNYIVELKMWQIAYSK